METSVSQKALLHLRKALNDPGAGFRAGQLEAIESMVARKEKLLVVQRTGWGKSIVYFIATKILRDEGKGPTLLISPLLSLMRNQIAMAERIGIKACTINSDNRDEWQTIKKELAGNRVDILLISPERLANDEFRTDMLEPVMDKIGLFVVDEAHCISDWGHDFRPDYRRIARILQSLPKNIPVLATTATANHRVEKDCLDQLGTSLRAIRGPLGRESLKLQNITLGSSTARMAWLADHLPDIPGRGIIYALTIRDAIRLAKWLQHRGINVEVYYGGVKDAEKLEDDLLKNRVKALVATTALSMGFDKPDLGFVIHYQRPGSAVHYYQQVGRAGRAIKQAYGILLSGNEDDDITSYFIRNAFPLEAHAEQVLKALEKAPHGHSLYTIQSEVNLPKTRIENILKYLAVQTPAPIVKQDKKWFKSQVPYKPDHEKIRHLTGLREQEQQQMRNYRDNAGCLMAFLQKELDDTNIKPCGVCANCRGAELIPAAYLPETEEAAKEYLRVNHPVIKPRKQWAGNALESYGWTGRLIPDALQAQEGRALCLWGDGRWGKLVRQGKQASNSFDQELADAMSEMIRKHWRIQPEPTWVTCVPSLTNPDLVPDIAQRLAKMLDLSFIPCVLKTKQTKPQKEMENSYQQARNLDGVFKVETAKIKSGPVLLVDDMVDSGWTFTVIAALLRESGSGLVYPAALAVTTSGGE